MTNVQQVRGSVTQNRSFTFNTTTGQMTGSSAPETGSATFGYNGDYTLAYKIDAKNQKVAYTYDSLKRVTLR